ncbi:hypothetical protein BB561_003013 [Smittium simulii]|uniref:Ketoreductase domain-containing protein n=1 Tax=Smittium simulii TaxID=133385 RepID=A0A2T9YN92_9FUNG|nr:hypothetical protein BB561_003013 [Smittium simulii]
MTANHLRFDGRVVIVTGAGGASVVVNDLGVGPLGTTGTSSAADKIVAEITQNGGKAIANYDSVEFGEKIVAQTVQTFGRVDILINNAGNLRDRTFLRMTESEWEQVLHVHLTGSYKVARAAWNVMKKQKFGRIINTASTSGVYGNFGQSNYASAKYGILGFSNTLAREGARYNILCNTLVPTAASSMTATSMAQEIMNIYDPKYVAPLVLALTHESSKHNGLVFEAAGGFFASSRWELSSGALLKPDSSLTPAAVKHAWPQITNFSNPSYPTGPGDVNYVELVKKAMNLPSNPQGSELRFDGQVAVVTGGGQGLGREYSLLFARYGAKVVVNDVGIGKDGIKNADRVVSEIKKSGGQAVANHDSVEYGERIVQTAIATFGRIDIIINNAGILRDVSFANMTDKQWLDIYRVHLYGAFKVTHAAWPHFIKQKSGVIINASSTSGIYGSYGQANYSAAKAALLGFTNVLALEGAKYNIRSIAIAPTAGTDMLATVAPREVLDVIKAAYIAPFVGYLAHSSCTENGSFYQLGGTWCGQIRRQRSGGVIYPQNDKITPELVSNNLSTIINFNDGRAKYMPSNRDNSSQIIQQIVTTNGLKLDSSASNNKRASAANSKIIDVLAARNHNFPSSEFKYTERDIMLYALGIGASTKDLNLVYELDPNFQTIPSFAVIPAFFLKANAQDFLPAYHPMMLLHGEQSVQLFDNFPTSGTLVCKPKIVDIVDKGKGATVCMGISLYNKATKKLIAQTESTSFIRGIGGFSKASGFKPAPPAQRAAFSTMTFSTPKVTPDCVIQQAIGRDQAAIYRLSGDYNPLHIDPEMAAKGNFNQPILHGLCSMGYVTRHVINGVCGGDPTRLAAIKVRFSSPVYPGETIQTRIWVDKTNPKLIKFEAIIVERGIVAINNAIAELKTPATLSSTPKL